MLNSLNDINSVDARRPSTYIRLDERTFGRKLVDQIGVGNHFRAAPGDFANHLPLSACGNVGHSIAAQLNGGGA